MYWYAEIAAKDVGEERLRRAHTVVAWCCRELGISATLATVRWFVPQTQDDVQVCGSQRATWAWGHFDHISLFNHEKRINGRCSSPDEIWVEWGRDYAGQDETICHELCHMSSKQLHHADYEDLASAYGKSMAARIDWTRATGDYVDWLVDPKRWSDKPKASAAKVPTARAARAGTNSRASKPAARASGPQTRSPLYPVTASAMTAYTGAQETLRTARAKSDCGMRCASLEHGHIVNRAGTCKGHDCKGSKLGAAVEAARASLSIARRVEMRARAGASMPSIGAQIMAGSPPVPRAAYELGQRVMAARRAR